MLEFLRKLFDTEDFPPRWECGTWSAGHGWLHIISDSAIFLAYTAIPIALFVFAWKKHQEILHQKVVWLFALFILSCGVTHLLEATLFWNPIYRAAGVMKAITAVVSLLTVIEVVRQLPKALVLPGIVKVNDVLEKTVIKQQQSNEDLKKSNETLDEFAYVASHDLKAPLRAIEKLSNWISEDCEDVLPQKSKTHLSQLNQRVQRMEAMLSDLLTYSQGGRASFEFEEVDTGVLVNQILEDSFRISNPKKNLLVSENMPIVRVQRVPLEHCLRNLISNAIKHHNKEGGTVRISGKKTSGGSEFVIEDDGPGIPAEFHQRIFEMFETLRTRDEVEGSGMGLSIVKKLIENLGGTITLESEPGAGSKFTIQIPE